MFYIVGPSGLVVARMQSTEAEAIANTPPGGRVVFFPGDADWFEGDDPKTLPERPSPHHEWDWTTKSWLPNLDAAREAQRQAWNAWRDRELVAGYAHNGHVFHSDETFMSELHTLIKGYEQGYFTGTSEIRTKGNVVLQMSHIEIETLLLLLGQHRQAIYRQSWTGKDALPGKATLEAIMAGGPPT